MRNNAREVSCYLSIEEADRFREAASANKVSLSRYLRQCLLDYERLSDDGSRAPNGFALVEMEERLALNIELQSRQVNSLCSELHVLFAMIDRLAFVSLVHLPEIPVELRDHLLDALALNGGQRGPHKFLIETAELFEQRPRCRR